MFADTTHGVATILSDDHFYRMFRKGVMPGYQGSTAFDLPPALWRRLSAEFYQIRSASPTSTGTPCR
jgi:hypothetical protein